MIPTISETKVREDYMYEDDDEVRIIHGLKNAMKYAHPGTRTSFGSGVMIKDKRGYNNGTKTF